MKKLIVATAAALLLGACTPGQLIKEAEDAKKLTLEDFKQYVDQIHTHRYQVRGAGHGMLETIGSKCEERVAGAESISAAIKIYDQCAPFLKKNSPKLAIPELADELRDARDSLKDLQGNAQSSVPAR